MKLLEIKMSTKTSMFLRLLIKICFVPIYPKDEKIVFKVLSIKTLLFLLIYGAGFFILEACVILISEIKPEIIIEENAGGSGFIETISFFLTFLSGAFYFTH